MSKSILSITTTSSMPAFKFRGAVSTIDELPDTGNEGDIYHVTATSSEYVWINKPVKSGGAWEELCSAEDLEKDKKEEYKKTSSICPHCGAPYDKSQILYGDKCSYCGCYF